MKEGGKYPKKSYSILLTSFLNNSEIERLVWYWPTEFLSSQKHFYLFLIFSQITSPLFPLSQCFASSSIFQALLLNRFPNPQQIPFSLLFNLQSLSLAPVLLAFDLDIFLHHRFWVQNLGEYHGLTVKKTNSTPAQASTGRHWGADFVCPALVSVSAQGVHWTPFLVQFNCCSMPRRHKHQLLRACKLASVRWIFTAMAIWVKQVLL